MNFDMIGPAIVFDLDVLEVRLAVVSAGWHRMVL